MIHMLPPWPLLTAFLGASLLLAVTPGPAVIYIVTRSAAHGRKSGLASVAGVALGNLGNVIAAAFGLAALFAVSGAAFSVVRYVGALYLIYLGIRAWRTPRSAVGSQIIVPEKSRNIFGDGLVVALFNPKTTLFFAAFLPQFTGGETGSALQSVILGALFVAIAVVTDTLYALAADGVATRLVDARKYRRPGRYLNGCVMIALGLFTAFGAIRPAASYRMRP